MASKNFVFVIVGHQGYISDNSSNPNFNVENDILFSSISQTYLPLINLLNRLSGEDLKFKVSLVLSPALCSLLDDKDVQARYVEWLDKKIALGLKEVERLGDGCDDRIVRLAQKTLAKAELDKIDFTQKYDQNLLAQFAELQKKGLIELLATCGTYAFLPHYSDMKEVLNAQIETGLFSHKRFFGSKPDGFWLPFMGYTSRIERVLHSYGINYTIVNEKTLLFSDTVPENGIFYPVRCLNDELNSLSSTSLALFANDSSTEDAVLEFIKNPCYKDMGRDIGFELPAENLEDFIEKGSARVSTGYKYWSKASEDAVYDDEKASEQVKKDAKDFVESKINKLSAAHECMNGKNASLVCVLDAKYFGQEWAEGIEFLENVIRFGAVSDDVEMESCSSLIENQFNLPKIVPYEGVAEGNCYGEYLLDSTNGWMLRYTRKMCERMVDLSDRYPNDTGLKIRLLDLAARELLLAQSGEWAKMIHDGNFAEYATERFRGCIKAFMIAYEALGSNVVSTEWLTKVEKQDRIFPWMNFRVFTPKK